MSLLTIPITLIFSSARQFRKKKTRHRVSILWFKRGHTFTGYSHRTISERNRLQDTRFNFFLLPSSVQELSTGFFHFGRVCVFCKRPNLYGRTPWARDRLTSKRVLHDTNLKITKEMQDTRARFIFSCRMCNRQFAWNSFISLEAGKRSNYHQITHFLCSSDKRYPFHKPWHFIPNINHLNLTHILKL